MASMLPSQPPSNQAQFAVRKRAPRIKQAGVAILEEYYRQNPTSDPPLEDQERLLQQIHAIPGCEHYEAHNLHSWFYRRRPMKNPEMKNAIFFSSYPTLTNQAIVHLTNLHNAQPFPPDNVIDTWATLLLANKEDVVAWIEEQNLAKGLKNTQMTSPHLPTPVSPGPSTTTGHDRSTKWVGKVDPTISPVLPPSPQSATFRTSKFVTQETPDVKTPRQLPRQMLLQALAEAAAKPNLEYAGTLVAQNANEFEQMFGQYIDKMNFIIAQCHD